MTRAKSVVVWKTRVKCVLSAEKSCEISVKAIRYQPKPIATGAENDAAIALACELEYRPMRSLEEELFLELLITLIEKFEAENYPIPKGDSASMLRHLMDARDLDKSDLIPVLGTQTEVDKIIVGERDLEIDEARKLADFFRVDISLFL